METNRGIQITLIRTKHLGYFRLLQYHSVTFDRLVARDTVHYSYSLYIKVLSCSISIATNLSASNYTVQYRIATELWQAGLMDIICIKPQALICLISYGMLHWMPYV